jgi:hypothetical protein
MSTCSTSNNTGYSPTSPTIPTSGTSRYLPRSSFLEAQLKYESLGTIDIDKAVKNLDNALKNYNEVTCISTPPKQLSDSLPGSNKIILQGSGTCKSTTPDLPTKKLAVEAAFAPIADYYSKLINLNTTLQTYIDNAANNIVNFDSTLESEERYENRIHPENTMMARESMMPELRITTIPYLIAISVFMASLSIFLIFQLFGFSGQLNLPSSLISLFSSPALGSVPFYENPMIIGGVGIILVVMTIIFAVLYFRSKNTNRD